MPIALTSLDGSGKRSGDIWQVLDINAENDTIPAGGRAAGPRIRLIHAANEVHLAHKMTASFADTLKHLEPGAFDLQISPIVSLGQTNKILNPPLPARLS